MSGQPETQYDAIEADGGVYARLDAELGNGVVNPDTLRRWAAGWEAAAEAVDLTDAGLAVTEAPPKGGKGGK